MPIRTDSVLLFDLGGVLIESQMFSELKRLMNTDQSEAELIEVWLRNPVAKQFELGQCSVDEFSQSIVREFGLDLPPADFLAEFKDWPKGFYAGVDSTLSELRNTHTVSCLSNSNEAHWTDAITDHFDFAFSSHLIGRIKPNRDAFEHVLDTIGVEAGAVHFFDDALMNVEAASSCGLNAHHTIGYDSLKRTLLELGFLS
ncbi:MAG: HAD-IA family hydrolase [Pseudomonadota bacterium]